MSEQNSPKWMADPRVAGIEKSKLDFLQSVVFESRGKSTKELIPFLMGIIKQGKANNFSFTNEEMSTLMTVIKENSTPEELEQFNKFMSMHKNAATK